MPRVRSNVASNIVGTLAITALTFIVTPFQVHLLGMGSYGVIGFVATLQVAFTAFDLGLSSTVVREVAADRSADRQSTSRLMATAVTVYWGIAVLLGVALFAAAGWVAGSWLQADQATSDLTTSIRVIALYLALRWPVALYSGILTGLQRLDLVNVLKVASATLRLLGGLGAILIWRTLDSFLWWTAAAAAIEVGAFAFTCRRVYPSLSHRPTISREALRPIWRFAMRMNAISVIAIVLVQADRFTISRLLPLEALGRYNLAYTAASLATLIISAVSTAVLPFFAAGHSDGVDVLRQRYLLAERGMLLLVTPLSFSLIAYGPALLRLWVGSSAAIGTGPVIVMLALGFWLSALVANLYNVAVARGAPNTFLSVNFAVILPYVALMIFMIGRFGIPGAAASWLVLQVFYCLMLIPLEQRHLTGLRTRTWFINLVFPEALSGLICFIVAQQVLTRVIGWPDLMSCVIGLPAGGLVYLGLSAWRGGLSVATVRSFVQSRGCASVSDL